ncbi:MAG: DUF4358 domain-containing protein [Candidatus Ornithomonoglobus sp.]
MKKKMYALAVILLCTALFAGCGKKREVSGTELAQVLCREVPFSEALAEIDNTTSSKLLYLNPNEYSRITMYVGTQSTCDEFAIVETSNPESVTEKIESYLAQKKSNYLVYRPAEADKIDNAYITTYKNAVVMVVCSNPIASETAFKNYLKN